MHQKAGTPPGSTQDIRGPNKHKLLKNGGSPKASNNTTAPVVTFGQQADTKSMGVPTVASGRRRSQALEMPFFGQKPPFEGSTHLYCSL